MGFQAKAFAKALYRSSKIVMWGAEVEADGMEEVLEAKFKQSLPFHEALMDTTGKLLYSNKGPKMAQVCEIPTVPEVPLWFGQLNRQKLTCLTCSGQC